MRRDLERLADIIEAGKAIGDFVSEKDEVTFLADEMLQDAVSYALTKIGETVARLSSDLRRRHPEVPWTTIVGFRNVLVHEYWKVDLRRIWRVATKDVPSLCARATKILGEEEQRGGES